MSLGELVRSKREEQGLSLGQLARKLGERWDVARLSAVEHDRAHAKALGQEDFELLSIALDVDVDLLIEESGVCPHCLGTGKKEG
jgi:transcriptional regulator with XRE-family HTH domain